MCTEETHNAQILTNQEEHSKHVLAIQHAVLVIVILT